MKKTKILLAVVLGMTSMMSLNQANAMQQREVTNLPAVKTFLVQNPRALEGYGVKARDLHARAQSQEGSVVALVGGQELAEKIVKDEAQYGQNPAMSSLVRLLKLELAPEHGLDEPPHADAPLTEVERLQRQVAELEGRLRAQPAPQAAAPLNLTAVDPNLFKTITEPQINVALQGKAGRAVLPLALKRTYPEMFRLFESLKKNQEVVDGVAISAFAQDPVQLIAKLKSGGGKAREAVAKLNELMHLQGPNALEASDAQLVQNVETKLAAFVQQKERAAKAQGGDEHKAALAQKFTARHLDEAGIKKLIPLLGEEVLVELGVARVPAITIQDIITDKMGADGSKGALAITDLTEAMGTRDAQYTGEQALVTAFGQGDLASLFAVEDANNATKLDAIVDVIEGKVAQLIAGKNQTTWGTVDKDALGQQLAALRACYDLANEGIQADDKTDPNKAKTAYEAIKTKIEAFKLQINPAPVAPAEDAFLKAIAAKVPTLGWTGREGVAQADTLAQALKTEIDQEKQAAIQAAIQAAKPALETEAKKDERLTAVNMVRALFAKLDVKTQRALGALPEGKALLVDYAGQAIPTKTFDEILTEELGADGTGTGLKVTDLTEAMGNKDAQYTGEQALVTAFGQGDLASLFAVEDADTPVKLAAMVTFIKEKINAITTATKQAGWSNLDKTELKGHLAALRACYDTAVAGAAKNDGQKGAYDAIVVDLAQTTTFKVPA